MSAYRGGGDPGKGTFKVSAGMRALMYLGLVLGCALIGLGIHRVAVTTPPAPPVPCSDYVWIGRMEGCSQTVECTHPDHRLIIQREGSLALVACRCPGSMPLAVPSASAAPAGAP